MQTRKRQSQNYLRLQVFRKWRTSQSQAAQAAPSTCPSAPRVGQILQQLQCIHMIGYFWFFAAILAGLRVVATMPRQLKQLANNPDLVKQYSAAFSNESRLKQAWSWQILPFINFPVFFVHGTPLQVGFSFCALPTPTACSTQRRMPH